MVTFARGVSKTVAIATELVSFGTQGAGPGQLLRRTSSDLNLNVQQIDSQEILPSQQLRDSRHGPFSTQGTLSGQLSPKSYSMLFENLMRGTFTAAGARPSVTDCTGTLDGNGNLILTSATAAWSTNLKLGDIVLVSQAANNFNFRIVAITGTVLTLNPIVGTPTAFASGSGVVVSGVGKKLIIPAAGSQLDRSVTLEHWYGDIGQSELFLGNKVSQISLNIPPSGFVTFQASLTGQNMVPSATQAYPSATAVTTSSSLTAVSGKVLYQGLPILYLTGLNMQIATQAQAPQVVGSNQVPAIFTSQLSVRGSLTALHATDSLTADFVNEAEVALSVTMTTSPSGTADFVSLFVPRVKLSSSTKTDSQSAITRSYSFMALEYVGGVSTIDPTTIVVQDSLA